MTDRRDEPSWANDPDGNQIPDITTSPGTIPQTPLRGRAPSRRQARRDAEEPGAPDGSAT